jgi:hypothetical protein
VISETPALPNAQFGPGLGEGNALLRAEALRQLDWQRRDWVRILGTRAPGTPCLVPSAEHAGLHDGLDLLREAGEVVPARLYRRGSLVRSLDAAGGTAASTSLAGLLAGTT